MKDFRTPRCEAQVDREEGPNERDDRIRERGTVQGNEERKGDRSEKGHFGHLPLLRGILPIDRDRIPLEILAGLTLAAVCIPQSIGYARIAGMPVVTGLYTILIPMIIFALVGSSRHLVIGADSASAAIMAAGLAGVAIAGSSRYIALASTLAILVGVLLLLSRLFRMRFLADFLSRTAAVGLLSGVGIDIAIGQVTGMLGLPSTSGNILQGPLEVVRTTSDLSLVALVTSLLVIVALVGTERVSSRFPSMLLVVVGAIIASAALDLQGHGLAVIGTVQGGPPMIGIPNLQDLSVLPQLSFTLVSLFVVIIAQSVSISRSYAAKNKEDLDEDADVLGLSLANIGAGLSGTFVVDGGVSQTAVAEVAGARSQIAQLTTVAMVVIVLLFLTSPLALLPVAALSAIVFIIGLRTIDVRSMRDIYSKSRAEFTIAMLTLITAVVVGVSEAAILAIILSLLYHVQMGYRLKNSVMVLSRHGHVRPVPLSEARQMVPGLLVYRFNHGMYYANSERLYKEVMGLAKDGPPDVLWLCIDLSAVSNVDVTSGDTLLRLADDLQEIGVRLVLTDMTPVVSKELERFGVTNKIGRDAQYEDLESVIEDLERRGVRRNC